MKTECIGIREKFDSLNTLTPKEWRYIILHIENCKSCHSKLFKRLGNGKSEGHYSRNIFLMMCIKLRISITLDESHKKVFPEIHECLDEKKLVSSFKKNSINKFTQEELESIFEHNDTCKICHSINNDFEKIFASILRGELSKQSTLQ